MKTIDSTFYNTLEVKQSKFISYLMPIDMFKETLKKLQEEHPKARHFVSASRYVNDYEQIVESSSDDGEPRGTSGKPTLMVLQGQELVNIAVITVRYFGGIKLGTGGLVRAYSDATNDVIKIASLSEYQKKEVFRIACLYHDIGKVIYELENLMITIVDKKFESFEVVFTIACHQEIFNNLCDKTKRFIKVF